MAHSSQDIKNPTCKYRTINIKQNKEVYQEGRIELTGPGSEKPCSQLAKRSILFW